ncbi:MAG: hypothetical protein NWE95_10885 [Candidatus Bathyarchaeota archaeon]|nr:hypothetical protein [Candidatus Bathyarchaeota archaeon]
MKRVSVFLVIVIVSLAALVTLTAVGFVVFASNSVTQGSSDWMHRMWGSSGMMGQNGNVANSTDSMLPYFGVTFAVLIAVTVIGLVGLGYYLLYPQIKVGVVSPAVVSDKLGSGVSAFESVSKTLTVDERKVVDVLNAHDGKYLQKYIRSETGLSRLKTHRIIARLAERGVVSLEKVGNTNQVYLANWLQSKEQ